jgi:hypothetical protein
LLSSRQICCAQLSVLHGVTVERRFNTNVGNEWGKGSYVTPSNKYHTNNEEASVGRAT